jgi:hypothetical protein
VRVELRVVLEGLKRRVVGESLFIGGGGIGVVSYPSLEVSLRIGWIEGVLEWLIVIEALVGEGEEGVGREGRGGFTFIAEEVVEGREASVGDGLDVVRLVDVLEDADLVVGSKGMGRKEREEGIGDEVGAEDTISGTDERT